MKFGAQLAEEIFVPWRLAYIQYDVLKTELKARQEDHGWTDQDEKDFTALLENELEKVYDFVNAKLGEVEARISYCERSIRTFTNNPTYSSEQNWAVMDEALTEVLFDVNDLAKFTRLNYIGFQKIIKKHDKWTQLNLQQAFVPQLRAKPLDKQRFDVAIVFISSLHDICQLKGKPRTGNAAAGGDQNAFERATAKYWIHPDNITEVKSIIMLHLPVLIFNDTKPFEPSDAAISSVYFDNPDFDLYTGRLQRDEGAEAIRFRWYGPMSSNSIFIERKTHHAWWLDGASVKDRFRLDESDVYKFMSGELSASTYADRLKAKGTDEQLVKDNLFIANGIQTSLKEKNLDPVLRAFYNRTAFQLPGDQRVRVSLDTDLTFIREDNFDQQRRGPGEWRRPDVGIDYPFSYLNDADVLRFPYAVLETKLQTHLGQEPPAWLTNLLDSHLVHEVPRFSKYLHGACHFYADRMPLLPWWLSEMDLDIRKPRATNFGLTRSRSFKPLIDGHYSRAMEQEENRMKAVADESYAYEQEKQQQVSLAVPQPLHQHHQHQLQDNTALQYSPPIEEGKKKKKNRADVTAISLGEPVAEDDKNNKFVGITKVPRIAGGVFLGIAAVVAIYALYRFEKRAYMINRRILGRYDDLWGPAILCVLLVGALIVNFYLRFR
ncbi:VTC domain-containing protein [Halteromyces radiatus]|uniref:VTC domain-containing protein n=1 Tax=Halteromyces radiatus TaxID=101107 RepID=UPI00221E8675|nr:VTC domain-containing protein [Halteromyces radiatus]KAI8092913.1 VTC domain-containing protein [Halteromyces radiatus]